MRLNVVNIRSNCLSIQFAEVGRRTRFYPSRATSNARVKKEPAVSLCVVKFEGYRCALDESTILLALCSSRDETFDYQQLHP
jgi:hypothetical protein